MTVKHTLPELIELATTTPEWTPATNRPSTGTEVMPQPVAADLPDKPRKAGRPRKNQGDADSDDSPETAKVVSEGRGGKRLLKILAGIQDDWQLFYDNTGTSYIMFSGWGLEPLGKNGALEERLALLYYKTTNETLGADGFLAAVKVLAGYAKEIGTEIEMHTRAGRHDGRIYYDLKNGRALSIGADGWVIDSPPTVYFRNFPAQQAQPDPVKGGNPWLLFEHVNVAEEYRLMLMVWLIAAFVPNLPFPALLVSGSQGSGKSFFTALCKRIIDPAIAALQDNPKRDEDFDLLLYKHFCLAIDNLSNLPAARADRICSAITGSFVEMRILFTNLDTIVMPCNPRIILNGINSISNRPDLLDRSITIQLERITPTKRRLEDEMNESFDVDLPLILGGIADTLSKAIAIHATVKLSSYPRMADFCKWGYAVAEALGGRGAEFLKAYGGNAAKLGEGLIENNTLMSGLVQLMDSDGVTHKGSFKEIIEKLALIVTPDRTDYSFPTSHTFRKHMERLRPNLEELGITFLLPKNHTNKGQTIEITKQPPPGNWSATAADALPVVIPVTSPVADDLVFDEEELTQ